MKLGSRLLIGAAGLAFAALPVNLESIAFGSPEFSSAFAKSDHGGSNGGGHGHSGEHGKSGDAGGRGKSGGVGAGQSGRLRTIVGEQTHRAKGKKATDTRVAKSSKAKSSKKKDAEVELAALPDVALVPEPKEKSLHARLAGLNSLNRNYHAYLNAKDPRMESIRAFVMASANLDVLGDAEADFQAKLDEANLQAFDQAPGVYDDPSLQDLQDRLDVLENTTVAPEDMEAWQAEVDGLKAVLGSDEALALSKAEEPLREALIDAANRNRIAQYGDDYVNDDVMDWAKDVLGVGDRVGKIDEVRETLEIDSQ